MAMFSVMIHIMESLFHFSHKKMCLLTAEVTILWSHFLVQQFSVVLHVTVDTTSEDAKV